LTGRGECYNFTMTHPSSGEFGLIKDISKLIGKNSKSVVKGIGDDCAAIDAGGKKYLLAATDTIVESVHFDLKYYSYFDVGWKALAVNLSDIAAMGGAPKYALVSLGLTKKTRPRDVSGIYKGMKQLAKKFSVDIVGGDIVRSPEKLSVTVSILGELEKKKALYRNGAMPGDLIMVTGAFGTSALQHFSTSALAPRINEGRTIALSGKATAMMDSSDGLAFTIGEICRQSRTGAQVVRSLVPRAEGASLKDALYAGEDFELVFTCPPKFADIIADKVRSAGGVRVSIIGKIAARSKGINIDTKGFEHF
jgi:thiamine-monophosphate kinase